MQATTLTTGEPADPAARSTTTSARAAAWPRSPIPCPDSRGRRCPGS
jgi:hypothetical protein